MYDVVALGELLIDFTPAGQSEQGNCLFACNPGGAPANVLTCLARLGKRTGFLGKVGDDQFGRFLRQVLRAETIATEGLVLSAEAQTTLAFVHLQPDGERSFSFYRSPGADTMLKPDELKAALFNARIFHFGSLSLTNEPARSATMAALQSAKSRGLLVSYDPNLRPLLWPDLTEAKTQMLGVMDQADVVKISRDELEFLTGSGHLEQSSERLFQQYGLSMLLVTLGEDGCYFRLGRLGGHVPGFGVRAVDATGAGDAFLGGMLYQILQRRKAIDQWTLEEMEASVRFANAIGALVTTRQGAIPAMPTLGEVVQLLATG
ncbi:MAG: PfkB family carbohydrate kinase [Bacillota bacterium]|jgi:fructokinase|nr:PfkB family carbohydrate kinase [Bacillota bacterium]